MTPTGPLALAHVQARVLGMMAACAAGSCRYADPGRTRSQCEADRTAGCDGYAGHVHVEDGGPVLRWSRCHRYWAWWRAEKLRMEKRRAAEARTKRGQEPRNWSGEP